MHAALLQDVWEFLVGKRILSVSLMHAALLPDVLLGNSWAAKEVSPSRVLKLVLGYARVVTEAVVRRARTSETI
eukprot:4189722-Amphidinium_carterae.1